MNITFDAIPLISDKITGIGWCEAGQTMKLAELYPENRCEYSFFADSNGNAVRQIKQFAGRNIRLNTSRFPKKLYRLLSVLLPVPYSAFFGKQSDVTHFFNYIIPPGVKGKTVVTVHDMVYKAFPETVRGRTRFMLDAGLKKSLKRADIVVTDSEFSRTEIVKYFPWCAGKLRVVPCGVDTKKFQPCGDAQKIDDVKASLGIEGEYFLYLGTIEPRKNLERLISAYNAFSKKAANPPKLVLAGGKGWLYDGIFSRVKSLGLEDKVIFTKYVPSGDMNALMSGALAFVFPSLYEGFGMPPLEAMACGVPVLVSGEASLPEVTGDCAVIVDPYDVKSIARGLYKLYTNEPLRRDLSRRGLERAKEFTWDRSALMLHDIYKELVS